jgi:tRNA threonylcarbamoyladenosine biosynthesis protein TsaE
MTDARILDEAGLNAVAVELAASLPAGAVLWLEGPLGAGKTAFVRAFARARGCRVAATSPTYALAHRYAGPRGDTWHLDCYRLRDPEEAADLDWEEFTTADALLIEWPERAGPWAPQPDRTIRLAHADLDSRRVEVIGC